MQGVRIKLFILNIFCMITVCMHCFKLIELRKRKYKSKNSNKKWSAIKENKEK